MSSNPAKADVRVLMPVFNGGRALRDTLVNLLAQTHREFEILVYDDGSKDRTPEILEAMHKEDSRVTFHRCDENKGRGFARNALLELSAGQLIAWQDADDSWSPTKLEEQLNALRPLLDAGERAVLLSTYQINRLDDGGPPVIKTPPAEIDVAHILTGAYRNYHFQLQAVMGPCDLFREAGGFDPEMNWTEDLDVALKLLRIGARLIGHPTAQPLAIYNHTLKRAQPRVAEAGQTAVRERFRGFAREQGYDIDKVLTLRSVGYLGKMYQLKGRRQKVIELALRAMAYVDPREPDDLERIQAIAALIMSVIRAPAAGGE